MDWIGYQPNFSLGYCANKTKQDQIQLQNYLHNNQRLLEDINDKGISKLTIAKKRGGEMTHPGWFKKDKPVTRSGNSDGKNKNKNYMMKKKKKWLVQEK